MVAQHEQRDARKRQFGLKGLLSLFVVLSVLFSFPNYWRQHQLANEQEAHLSRFRQVVVALFSADEIYYDLPPVFIDTKSGKALHSWRFRLPRFMDRHDGWMDDLTAWDSPANRQFWARNYHFDLRWAGPRGPSPNQATNIFAITGPGTVFNDDRSLSDLSDAESDAILIVEVRDSQTNWMQPGDFDIRTMPQTINAPDGRGISGVRPDGFCVGFADGAAWFLSNRTPFAELRKFFTIEGARRHDREDVLGEYRLAD